MANIPTKVLLFCGGALIAGIGAAYFTGVLDPVRERAVEMASVAVSDGSASSDAGQSSQGNMSAAAASSDAVTADAETQHENLLPDSAASGDQSVGTAGEDGTAASAEAAIDVVVPTFDVLRVEPDGSMVVAGRAAPSAEVEVLSGSSVLSTTQANGAGDFAAVLDQALKPGEHNVVLRGTSPDTVATSVETAIVSIPSGEDGQVVALVQQPGEPSRLITVPQPQQSSSPGEAEDRRQAAGTSETTDDAATGEQPIAQAGEQRAQTDQGNDGTDATAHANAGSEAFPGEAGSGSSETVAEARPQGAADSGQSGTGGTAPAAQENASGDAKDVSPFIEAVEIDGREVFVAGQAEPGRRVRVYVNDILLGQTDVSPEGAFLIEAERDLPAGDYIIRADVLGDDGSTVIARAAVPFERPASEKFAAVAGESAANVLPDERAGRGENAEPGATGAQSDAVSPPIDDKINADRVARLEPNGGETSPSGQSNTGTVQSDTADRQTDETEEKVANEIVLPPLTPTEGSVIIRRGDTLWHISRRIYGQGVRYSTIYLANQDQIRDPDLIYPGQIFTVPEQTGDGEKANLGAIGEQAYSPNQADIRDTDS